MPTRTNVPTSTQVAVSGSNHHDGMSFGAPSRRLAGIGTSRVAVAPDISCSVCVPEVTVTSAKPKVLMGTTSPSSWSPSNSPGKASSSRVFDGSKVVSVTVALPVKVPPLSLTSAPPGMVTSPPSDVVIVPPAPAEIVPEASYTPRTAFWSLSRTPVPASLSRR